MFKRFALFFFIALLLPFSSLAYTNPQTGLQTYYPYSVTAQLNQSIYTRTGPGTEYSSLGSFLSSGDYADIVSLTYDRNGVAWVQVEMYISGTPVRVYTGLKRFDGVNSQSLIRDENYRDTVWVTRQATPLFGPGYGYGCYTFTLPQYTEVTIIQYEGSFVMCDFRYNGQQHRGWFPSDIVP